MRIYKYDRCGKYISKDMRDFFVRKPARHVYRFGRKRHLCEDCADSFDQWLRHPDMDAENGKPDGSE